MANEEYADVQQKVTNIFSSKSELQIDAAFIFAGSDFASARVYSSLRQDITAF
jgi:hypothetical protein